MKNYINHIVVFLIGAGIMSLEVTGSRVLAPFFGTSVIVWTSLIGLILLSLSIGYAIGGRLADKQPSQTVLTIILFTGALLVSLMGLVKGVVLENIYAVGGDLRIGVIAASLLLFTPPSILLAMVSPYAARLEMRSVDGAGKTVGNLNAIGTAGSIIGTFAAGFFLLAIVGNSMLLQLIAAVVLLAGLLSWWKDTERQNMSLIGVAVVLAVIGASLAFDAARAQEQIDIDTQYNRVFIYDEVDAMTQRPVRNLVTDGLAIQSSMFLGAPSELVLPYSRFYQLSEHFRPEIQKAAVIGGAAYSYPKYLVDRFPGIELDVVEIDQEMTALAEEYFELDTTQMNIHHADGRTFLNEAESDAYDVLFVDAYHSVFVPYQLTTREAVAEVHRSLTDDGIAVVNLITGMDGRYGKLLRAQVATYKEQFEQVEVFPVFQPHNGETVQNIILVATKEANGLSLTSDDPDVQSRLDHRRVEPLPEDLPILVDDYAPVDFYIMGML